MIQILTNEEMGNVKNPASAGILVVTPDKQFLLAKRSKTEKILPDVWSIPAGISRVNELESLEACAKRKFKEEVGYQISTETRLPLLDRYYFNEGIFFLFVFKVPQKLFLTIDNKQHSEIGWFTKESLPEPISLQVLDAISRI